MGIIGSSSADHLTKRVQDFGQPILLNPHEVKQTLHIYEGGIILLGPEESFDQRRPTWRQIFEAEGYPINDPDQVLKLLAGKGMEIDELDELVSDVCWPMAQACTWNPMSMAARLLDGLKIGPKFRSRAAGIGQLNFHYGDNHPGSSDVWVEVEDTTEVVEISLLF